LDITVTLNLSTLGKVPGSVTESMLALLERIWTKHKKIPRLIVLTAQPNMLVKQQE
jgi:hypothetical protein